MSLVSFQKPIFSTVEDIMWDLLVIWLAEVQNDINLLVGSTKVRRATRLSFTLEMSLDFMIIFAGVSTFLSTFEFLYPSILNGFNPGSADIP